MDKYIGRLLDNRYEILEVIGTGGMAVVYKARCHRLNRLVAIKILKDDYLQDEEFRRRFHAESQAVAMLSHPNIVSVYDVSTSIMADYIVMELVDGISLKQYMDTKGVLNWKETLHFGIQIAKALDHAHSRGIVHRDIKPHNVMVLKNGSVKVMDFGIARMMSKGNTLTKEALGSVHYISPEQAKGGRVDSRSDIYSLGVVMYEMMSGRPPYDGDSPVAVAIQHINGGAVMPSTLNPNIPGGLEQIIMKAMAHEINDRFTSASQMLADMDEFRKDPAMLFDYHTPPIDVVTQLPKTPLVLETGGSQTAAERAAVRAETPRCRPSAGTATRNQPQRRRRQEPEPASTNRVALISIIACSVVAVIAIAIFLIVLFSGGSTVSAPNLLEQYYTQALEADYPVKIKQQDTAYHDTIEEGKIISQHPAADTQMPKDGTVYVVVSLGPAPQPITMNNLANMPLEQARNYLNSQSLNLQIDVQEEPNEKIPAGNVIRTDPVEGTELTTGQKVTLYVSAGVVTKMIAVTDKTADQVKTFLEKLDMKLEITLVEETNATVEKGIVIRTDPAEGQDLATGQKVTIWVSTGPESVEMPNLVGMSVGSATNVLTGLGFPVPEIEMVESSTAKDEVINQSVQKDTMVALTTKIKLQVSKGPAETAAPTVPNVTKDVTIHLQGSAATGPCIVRVTRDGNPVYSGSVNQGTESITIKNQSGSGTVYYEVMINESDGWIEKVSF